MDSEIVDFTVPTGTDVSIHVNAAFDSFDEFFENYFQWMEQGTHPFTVQKSHCCANPRIKYVRVRYSCVHRGTPTYRGKGKRPNQTYLGQNCQAFLSIKYDKTLDKIVVKELNDQHNHPIGPELYQTYRQNRRLSSEEVARAKQLIQSNAPPDQVAKNISEFSGKAISKKDVYNLQTRLRNEEDKKPSRRHFRGDMPVRSVSLCQDYEDEVTISSEPSSEEPDLPKNRNGVRKRKTEEESAMQSLLESTLADVTGEKSNLLSLANIGPGDTDPIEEPMEVTISTISSAISAPSTSKRMKLHQPPGICVNPLGTKLNLIRLHQEGCDDIQTYDVGDLTISSRGAPIKPVSCIKPGQRIFIKTGSGAAAISRAPAVGFEVPKIAARRSLPKASRKSELVTKANDLAEALINGLVRVAPARQLNVLGQVCQSWKEQISQTLSFRQHPVWVMEHLILSNNSKIEDLLPKLELNLRRLAFEPRFVLSFVSASLFRPQFGPCDRRMNGISAFKDLLPKKSVLCEIYGVGIIGSSDASLSREQYQIIQAQECNVIGGVSALLMPNMRHAMPVCLVLDSKRLKEIANSHSVPVYVQQSFGLSRPPLKSLLLFEHGTPSPVAVKKLYDFLLENHPTGFACTGVEVCQSKVDAAIYTAEQQWGPTLIAIGFLGESVLSSSLYLTEAECADAVIMATRLMEWRGRLSASTFAETIGYSFVHFCFAFYSDKDHAGNPLQEERNPNTQFAACFPDVPLLGVQANGNLYGYSMDMAHMTDDVRKDATRIMQRKSEHACAFCIVSVPNV